MLARHNLRRIGCSITAQLVYGERPHFRKAVSMFTRLMDWIEEQRARRYLRSKGIDPDAPVILVRSVPEPKDIFDQDQWVRLACGERVGVRR